MKRLSVLFAILLLAGCQAAVSHGPSAYYVMGNTWEEIDQATDDVQAAQPLPAGKLVPDGGTTNQVLGKISDADGDTGWMDQSGSGTGILKWYSHKNIMSPAADTIYSWLRPFEDWKIASVVGVVDTGTADVDLQLCDTDLSNCLSFLTAPITLTTSEQIFTVAYDGITANNKLVATTVGTPTAGAITLDIHGTYESGVPPPVSGGCNIGHDQIGGDTSSITTTAAIINLFEAPCSGTAISAAFYSYEAAASNMKLCIYSDDGDEYPNSGDVRIGCAEFTASSTGWQTNSLDATGAITAGNKYWLVNIKDENSSTWPRTTDTIPETTYYYTVSFDYDSPPDNLGNPVNTDTTVINTSRYIEIQ